VLLCIRLCDDGNVLGNARANALRKKRMCKNSGISREKFRFLGAIRPSAKNGRFH
jgi:hypothetical protein